MAILITGISGFIGQNLLKTLRDKHEILALSRHSTTIPNVGKTLLWKDFTCVPTSVKSIIHLAGKAHDTKNQSSRESYFTANTNLTEQLFDAFLKSNAKQFVFFSSVKAVADNLNVPLTETAEPQPVGPYGESKLAAEKYIRSKQSEVAQLGKEVYILRPAMIHGPGNKGNLNLLYKVARLGMPWPLGSFDNRRSFCSIENLLFTLEAILNSKLQPGVYNVVDDKPLSTNTIIKCISEELGKRTLIWRLPKWIVQMGAKAGDTLHLPLNSERLAKLTENYEVSNQKLLHALGRERMPIDAIDGLRKTIRWFVENDKQRKDQ